MFSCRAVNVSAHEIAVVAPVTAKVGVLATANIEQLGRTRTVVRVFDLGFAVVSRRAIKNARCSRPGSIG